MPKKYGMVIDLHQCVGCGACALGCKNENNTQARSNGQSFNWADFVMKTEGVFPNTKYTQMPVLCNHCSDAPCVMACPVTPKAMFKADDNTTLHNQERCIGCRRCQDACPYSDFVLDESSNRGETYSVISFNLHGREVQAECFVEESVIFGGTSTAMEVSRKVNAIPPDRNDYQSGDYKPVRTAGVVEKCIFCHHRITQGFPKEGVGPAEMLPACVNACPANARIFGDLNDPESAVSTLLKKHKFFRLKEEEGTEPNVYYIRSYEDPTV